MTGGTNRAVSIIGCGFVADLYMRSLAKHSDVAVTQVYDRDPERLSAFAAHWKLRSVDSMERFMGNLPAGSLVLNLTNPSEHFEITQFIDQLTALIWRAKHHDAAKFFGLCVAQPVAGQDPPHAVRHDNHRAGGGIDTFRIQGLAGRLYRPSQENRGGQIRQTRRIDVLPDLVRAPELRITDEIVGQLHPG